MTNSPIVRFTIFFLIVASGCLGFLINEFIYFGEDFLAGVTTVMIPTFGMIGARFLRDNEPTRRRRPNSIGKAW